MDFHRGHLPTSAVCKMGLNPETARGDPVRRGDALGLGTQYNCEALVLIHPSMTRRQRVPAHRVWFEWGNAEADVTRTQTIFRFSRPDTQVAKALHSALSARKVAHEPLHFEETSREDRTLGSHAVLSAKQNSRTPQS